MPTPKKLKQEEKKREEQEEEEEEQDEDYSENESMTDEEDSQEDDDEENQKEEDNNEEIMIDFEARSIEESDMDSVKLLVQQKLGVFSLNVHEAAKIVVQQDSIGNVIYQSMPENEDNSENMEASNSNDDSTVFGVLSLIDLNSSRCKTFSNEFKTFILKESQKFDKKNNKNLTSQLNNFFKEKKVCFVVSERFINIPPGISVPMFESLLKDLDQVKSNENNFTADYWLFLSKRFQQDESSSSSSSSSDDSNLIYSNPEEEVFEQFSELKFEITYGKQTPKGTNGKWSSKDPELSTVINCLLVPFHKIKDSIEKIKTLL